MAPLCVLAGALLLFSINLDRAPHPDELHHVLAAQQLLETGRPLIGEGEYWRGIPYTALVAVSYELFGEGLASARAPSVLLVGLAACILFAWVRREADFLSAWISSGLFISSPFTVEIAQFSRFYSLQNLLFLLGSIGVYYALANSVPYRRRVLLGMVAAVLLGVATWVQEISIFGLVGIATWTFGLLSLRVYVVWSKGGVIWRRAALAIVLVGGLVLVASQIGMLEGAWERYRTPMLFNADRQSEFWYYFARLLVLYPTLWPLVGLLAVVAATRSTRFAWYAFTIFGVSFVLASFAGPKATRYFSFAAAFLAIVWGVGLAQTISFFRRNALEMRTRFVETIALPPRVGSGIATTLLLVACTIVVLSNPFWLRSAAMIGDVALPFETPTTDWRAAREALAPWTSDADIMITTEELGAMYFLGRSDVRFSPSKFRELEEDQRREFGIDFRTGRPVIATPASLERLIECFDRGIVVGPIEHWGSPILISESVQAVLKRHAGPIDIPKESHLYAWGWERNGAEPKPDHCAELQGFSGRKAE